MREGAKTSAYDIHLASRGIVIMICLSHESENTKSIARGLSPRCLKFLMPELNSGPLKTL